MPGVDIQGLTGRRSLSSLKSPWVFFPFFFQSTKNSPNKKWSCSYKWNSPFAQIARSTGRPSVIIYDRGLLDFAAYVPPDKWSSIANHTQWICDGVLHCVTKYDLILHLETAARGAESQFKRGSELGNQEELEAARPLDRKIQTCWRGHPHFRMVDNSTISEASLRDRRGTC